MILNNESLKSVVDDLIKNHQHPIAYKLIDYYYKRCSTISDYDCVGAIALKSLYADVAVQCAEKSYALAESSENLYYARSNLRKAYYQANIPHKAKFYNDLNLEQIPDDIDTLVAAAGIYRQLGQHKESEKVIDHILTFPLSDEKEKEIEFILAKRTLKEGDTALGIHYFIDSNKPTTTRFDILNMKKWDGIFRPGSNLYINANGGYGDELIFIRFLKHIKDAGMNPIYYSDLDRKDLNRVFENNGIEVITNTLEIDKKAPWINLMSLPVKYSIKEKDLWYGSYLKPSNSPKNKLKSTKKKIGINWSGNPFYAQDRGRSIPVDMMLKYLPKDCEIYSFNLDNEAPAGCIDLKDKINNWEDTLDFLSQMDLVISSCTSIVHAAGAIGTTTIVLPPTQEYFTWTSSRKDETSTPWYGDNFYICRQREAHNWIDPLEAARDIINKVLY